MAVEARTAGEVSSSPNDAIPQEIYDLADHQGSAVPGSPHKPDGVLFYSKRAIKDIRAVHVCVEAKIAPTPDVIPDPTMAQILDYMNALWVEQPTRTVVTRSSHNLTGITLSSHKRRTTDLAFTTPRSLIKRSTDNKF
ncbi:hypothetical protein LPJ59_002847 [Coemansia sp. RSA 2399]|nr:hypothetical protein LPJ59_002847 [Coemansia sp. RSA 2399]KAJ1904436.1 hypothetical protein LPJ81_002492 [Coemansia sp. IMI 209127]